MSTRCIICDIDGTIANLDHRLHYIKGEGKKNWKMFFEEMSKDTLHEDIDTILYYLLEGFMYVDVVFCSGRPSNYREVTEEWLKKNVMCIGLDQPKLYMRKSGDYRPDDIVKEELLAEIRADGYEPILALDDRNRVVDMWRRNGIRTLQVANGDF